MIASFVPRTRGEVSKAIKGLRTTTCPFSNLPIRSTSMLFCLFTCILVPAACLGQCNNIGPTSLAPFGTHMCLKIFGNGQSSIQEAGGRLVDNASSSYAASGDRFQASTEAKLDGVTPELKAHASSSGGGNTEVLYEFWDSAKISGSCPLSPDPGYLAPCIEFRWKVQGKLSAAGTGGLIGNAVINFDPYVNDGFDPPHGGGAAGIPGQAFTESTVNFVHCDADNSCAAQNDVSRNGLFLLSASGMSPELFRDGSTVGWGAFVTVSTGSASIPPDSQFDSSGEASFNALKRGVSLVILSRDPATKIEPSAAAIASGKAWKQEFGRWDVRHCPPFTPDVPTREFTVAYLPARFKAGTSNLSIQQIQDRAEYVTDYYYQQSMCSVLITPWIVTDQNTDGWLNLPNTEAGYNVAGQTSTLAENIPLAHIWLDAFVAASIASPDFLLRQQTPPPFGGFDAVVVIDTAQMQTQRARNFISEPVANRLPVFAGGALGFLASGFAWHAAVAPGVDLVAGVTAAFAAVFPTGLELTAILPGFVATLDNTLFKQASVIVADTDGTGIWVHELGHSLFGFWDYYATNETFVRGNTMMCFPSPSSSCHPSWGLMGDGSEQNPPPVTTYDKAIAGWLTNIDAPIFGYGDYPLVALKDMSFGSTVFRFQPTQGPVDWFIIELRMPPDDVPKTPEPSSVNVFNVGQKGVVIYADREPRLLDGRIPSCGDMTGPQKLALAELMGDGWLSCLDKVTNSGVPALKAPENFTLVPNTSYADPDSGVVFSLSDQFVLSIKPLGGTGAITSQSASASSRAATAVTKTP